MFWALISLRHYVLLMHARLLTLTCLFIHVIQWDLIEKERVPLSSIAAGAGGAAVVGGYLFQRYWTMRNEKLASEFVDDMVGFLCEREDVCGCMVGDAGIGVLCVCTGVVRWLFGGWLSASPTHARAGSFIHP